MAVTKRIIILDRPQQGTYRYLLWLDVPVARQPFHVNPLATSAWKDAAAGDITAIQQGAVVEIADTINIGGMTLAQVEAMLQNRWQTEQDNLSASGAGNPFQRYGTFWDGSTWTAGGVA